MAEATLKETQATVDYPQAGEVVTSPAYTIRIGAVDATKVEISIDDGPWQLCRFSAGHWWYDWSGYLPGKHQIKAQAHAKIGGVATSRPRQFTVTLAPSEK